MWSNGGRRIINTVNSLQLQKRRGTWTEVFRLSLENLLRWHKFSSRNRTPNETTFCTGLKWIIIFMYCFANFTAIWNNANSVSYLLSPVKACYTHMPVRKSCHDSRNTVFSVFWTSENRSKLHFHPTIWLDISRKVGGCVEFSLFLVLSLGMWQIFSTTWEVSPQRKLPENWNFGYLFAFFTHIPSLLK
jgi:hypothetical protein